MGWRKTKGGQAYKEKENKEITNLKPEQSEKSKKLSELGALTLTRNLKESRLTGNRFALESSDHNRTEVLTKLNSEADEILKTRLEEIKKIEELKKLDEQ